MASQLPFTARRMASAEGSRAICPIVVENFFEELKAKLGN